MGHIKGIIFDFGGTLDSGGDHWSHVIHDAWTAAGITTDYPTFRAAYIHGERNITPLVKAADNMLTLLTKKISLELLHAFGDDSRAQEIASLCYSHARECISHVLPPLEALAARFPMVIVSNFYGNLRSVLADYGMTHLFRGVIDSAESGVRKPDPAIFRLGLDMLGTEPGETLVVGDSIDKDILPALSLGCPTAIVTGRQWDDMPLSPLPDGCVRFRSIASLADHILEVGCER
ncbi:MAG: HAD family hydrolase [Muribaculaceae bacterium]|nr:HAD family hydrolase [Muribaculaceae bacterium]